MKKKIISLCLVVVLIAIAAIGGTLAYLKDTEQATNTMVVGNVQINIDEFQKDADGQYVPFEDDSFRLYPIDNAQGNQLRNKVVYTANTSTSKDDAFIRTIVLFEKNVNLTDDYVGEADCCIPGLHFGYFNTGKTEASAINGKNVHSSKAWKLDETVTIDETEYWIVVFEEVNGEAIGYDEALYSLKAVWMDKNIDSDQITGWGDQVDIIVVSQGIQTIGLSYDQAMDELGKVTPANVLSWIGAEDAVINNWN